MGFFKKDRKGGKCGGSYSKGGGIKGKDIKMGGYTLYSHMKEDGAKTTPITKKSGSEKS